MKWFSDLESAYNAGDTSSIPALGRFPGEANGNPLQCSNLGKRSLVGYSPDGQKELHMTEQPNNNNSEKSTGSDNVIPMERTLLPPNCSIYPHITT